MDKLIFAMIDQEMLAPFHIHQPAHCTSTTPPIRIDHALNTTLPRLLASNVRSRKDEHVEEDTMQNP